MSLDEKEVIEVEDRGAKSSLIPGLLLCGLIFTLSEGLGRLLPVVGAPVFAIVIGIAAGNLFRVPDIARPGISFSSRKILQLAIIVLGGSLSLTQIRKTGTESAGVMLVSLAVALIGAYFLGRKMGISKKLTCLVGVGTAICGGSAIAAVAPIIRADDDDIAFSISTIFLFNVAAVLIFPALGHLMKMGQNAFGLWAGTAINDTSSVVAAGYSYGKVAGDYAAIAKLARTTMIIPISLGLAMLSRGRRESGKLDIKNILPWFILGFLATALLNTSGILGPTGASIAGALGKYLIVIALAGVGLGANFDKMVKTGPKPMILGLLVWALVALSSLAMQAIR